MKKTYTYKTGYDSCEESEYEHLTHCVRYTEEQFKDIIHQIVLHLVPEERQHRITFQDIHGQVLDVLINEYGFKPLKVQTEWTCFGWANLLDVEDWKGDTGKEFRDLAQAIKEREEKK